jgi:hypothetical protein
MSDPKYSLGQEVIVILDQGYFNAKITHIDNVSYGGKIQYDVTLFYNNNNFEFEVPVQEDQIIITWDLIFAKD